MTAAWTAAITSKMHAAGFIAVSARFQSPARMLPPVGRNTRPMKNRKIRYITLIVAIAIAMPCACSSD
jgi:hypothetical protein